MRTNSFEDELSAAERAHSNEVRAYIDAAIDAAGGWIDFERYMDAALYAPGLGYYSAGAHKLGLGGDFVTAPEVSPLFGACLAEQCAQILRLMGGGSILELGAGTGRLAADLLTGLEAVSCLPERYYILDVSADLRARQRDSIERRVPHLAALVTWLDAPPARRIDGVIIANEVVDALPVQRFRWTAPVCQVMGVRTCDGEFEWCPRPADERMLTALRRWSDITTRFDEGYTSEFCPRLAAWVGGVAAALRRGAILWFDYGLPRAQYYLPERTDGTLICHFRQRVVEDPLRHPGLQDISAWVDFTALAEAGMAAGLDLAGFTTQALFLASTGIERHMQTLSRNDAQRYVRLAAQAKTLMLPGEMGERFKAMAHVRGLSGELLGFALRDLRHTL